MNAFESRDRVGESPEAPSLELVSLSIYPTASRRRLKMRQLHWVGADALTTGIDQVVAAHATGNAMNGYERPAADRATPVIVCRGVEGIRNRLFSRDNHFTYAQLARSSTVLLEQPNPTD